MAVQRKGNPRFRLRGNKAGGRSWMLNGDAVKDAAGLRVGLTELDEVARLPKQVSSMDSRWNTRRMESAGEHAFDAAAGALAFTSLRPWFARWRVRRRARQELGEVVPLRAYRREARRMVDAFPHVAGEVPRFESSSARFTDYYGFTHEVESSVDERGVAEISWKWLESREGEERVATEGGYVLYPQVDMERMEITHPVKAPGANLRGGKFAYSMFGSGSVLDGADLRDADLRGCLWGGVSLRGVDLRGADVTDARFPEDLTGTNITREQFESLADTRTSGEGLPYRVREASMEDVVAAYGGDKDATTVALWSGDVEVRDRRTHEVVTGGFDFEAHYIPAWALSTDARAG